MYTTFADYLKEDEILWKLQSAFWWGWKECAKDEDYIKAKQIAKPPEHCDYLQTLDWKMHLTLTC